MNPKNLIQVKTIEGDFADDSFIKKELPVILKAGCRNWVAFSKWTPEFFSSIYGNVEVPMSNYKKDPYQVAQTKPNLKIAEYLRSALGIAAGKSDENQDLYSAGWFFCRGYCELLKDVSVPPCFQENWADRVQKVIHFDTRSILFGHPKVESPLHTDSFFVSTWFAMIRGQKRMRLVPPEYTQYVQNGFNVYDDKLVDELGAHGVPVYDCVIEEGDVVWFPPGWWHHVKNDTFTISLTTNFVSHYHFLPFEQQVRAVLMKPILNLAKVKEDCVLKTAKDRENLVNFDHSSKAVVDSYFVRNEAKFLAHFQSELAKTERLLAHLQH